MDQRPHHGLGVQRVTDRDALGLFGDRRGEAVVNAGLDQQTAGGGAAFAVQRIDHEDGGIGGAVKVGIGKDHDRVLAAKLKMDALEGVGTLFHDHGAGAAFPHETDGLDVGMFGQGTARLFAQAVDKVPDPGRQARAFGDFDHQAGGERREFGGFVNDRAACGQRRGDLPCREHEGRVPRRDDADRADRAAAGDVDLGPRAQGLAVAGAGGEVGEIAEVFGAAEGGLGHEADRLAGVHRLDQRDFVGARLDGVGDAVEQSLAPVAIHRAPGREGGFGGSGGGGDVGGLATGDTGKGFQVDGRDRLECLTVQSGHGLACNVVQHALRPKAAKVHFGAGKVGGEIGHLGPIWRAGAGEWRSFSS